MSRMSTAPGSEDARGHRHQRRAAQRSRTRAHHDESPARRRVAAMRSGWLAGALAVGLSLPLGAQTPLSFRDAVTMTQQQNQQLQAADAHLEQSRAVRSA